jgi:hypothetical protein
VVVPFENPRLPNHLAARPAKDDVEVELFQVETPVIGGPVGHLTTPA